MDSAHHRVDPPRLNAIRVSTPGQIEWLRAIRNACRAGFSYDNEEIAYADQVAWWNKMQGCVKAWLFKDSGVIVGYGLVRLECGLWYASVAVLPSYNGLGFGKRITQQLIEQVEHPVIGVARLDNPAAMKLHAAPAWIEIGRNERLVTYYTSPELRSAR